jgi:hypothetical protein
MKNKENKTVFWDDMNNKPYLLFPDNGNNIMFIENGETILEITSTKIRYKDKEIDCEEDLVEKMLAIFNSYIR